MFTQDPGVISLGARYLSIVAIAQPFMALELVLESGMGGAGYTTRPTVASITLTGLRIPLAYWLAATVGVTGIWWTISLTGVARGLAMSLFWRAGRWRRALA
jgi:Na+-driven multidrug efflux pump